MKKRLKNMKIDTRQQLGASKRRKRTEVWSFLCPGVSKIWQDLSGGLTNYYTYIGILHQPRFQIMCTMCRVSWGHISKISVIAGDPGLDEPIYVHFLLSFTVPACSRLKIYTYIFSYLASHR